MDNECQNCEGLIIVKTQILMFKWLCTGLGSLILLLGAWVYAQGNETTDLKQINAGQEKTLTRHENWLQTNSNKTDTALTSVASLKKDVQYNGKTLDEIKDILKQVHKLNN